MSSHVLNNWNWSFHLEVSACNSTGGSRATCSVLVDYGDDLETIGHVRRMVYSNGIRVGLSSELCKSLQRRPQSCSSSQRSEAELCCSDWRNVWEDPRAETSASPAVAARLGRRHLTKLMSHASLKADLAASGGWTTLRRASKACVSPYGSNIYQGSRWREERRLDFFVTFWFESRASVVPLELQAVHASTHRVFWRFAQHLYTRVADGR